MLNYLEQISEMDPMKQEENGWNIDDSLFQNERVVLFTQSV
jgi:hypothetical protein